MRSGKIARVNATTVSFSFDWSRLYPKCCIIRLPGIMFVHVAPEQSSVFSLRFKKEHFSRTFLLCARSSVAVMVSWCSKRDNPDLLLCSRSVRETDTWEYFCLEVRVSTSELFRRSAVGRSVCRVRRDVRRVLISSSRTVKTRNVRSTILVYLLLCFMLVYKGTKRVERYQITIYLESTCPATIQCP